MEYWSTLPFRRRLRDYLRGEDALKREGYPGKLKYARDAVERLVDKYVPAEDPRTKKIMPKAALDRAVNSPDAIHLGRVRLVLKDEIWRSSGPRQNALDDAYSEVA